VLRYRRSLGTSCEVLPVTTRAEQISQFKSKVAINLEWFVN
jgi:hypothetical protein